MNNQDWQQALTSISTTIGIIGGLTGLLKYFSAKRDAELREWQKVIIHKLLRESENASASFARLLERYRSEAQAFEDITVRKSEISEISLRRVLMDMIASGIVLPEAQDSYRLKLAQNTSTPMQQAQELNSEIFKLIGSNPAIYNTEEAAKQIKPHLPYDVPFLRAHMRMLCDAGALETDSADRLSLRK